MAPKESDDHSRAPAPSPKESKPRPPKSGKAGAAESGAKAGDGGQRPDFPLVGLGVSSDDRQALQEFLAALPDDLNLSLVVLPLADASPESRSAAWLKAYTDLTVSVIKSGRSPRPRHVHICPPGRALSLTDGRFQVKTPRKGSEVEPLDLFFGSLALEMEANCAGIMLSDGTGDGAQGLREIRQAGGLALAQKGAGAAHDSMARELAPAEMPGALARHFSQTSLPDEQNENAERLFLEAAPQVFFQIKQRTRHDFAFYKTSTMRRRVERRMALHGLDDYQEYAKLLGENPGEVDELFQEMLINVTAFFRDREAWQALKLHGILPRLKEMKDGQSFRAWIPGCASGEEAYSLAILLSECIEEQKLDLGLQIFGTDIDPNAITRAREGRFPKSIAANLSPKQLKKYFRPDKHEYQVRKELREVLVFGEQDVMRDPPFSRLDLLVCRNLLIYLTSEAQQLLLPLFHYTLKPDGLLFLGSSESVGSHHRLFQAVDSTWKIYRRRQGSLAPGQELRFPTGTHQMHSPMDRQAGATAPDAPAGVEQKTPASTPRPSLAEQVREALLLEFTPAAVACDVKGNISYVHGDYGKYLEPAPQPSALNLLDSAQEGLIDEAAVLLERAAKTLEPQGGHGLVVRASGEAQPTKLTVKPLDIEQEPKLFLVVFQDLEHDQVDNKTGRNRDEGHKERIESLELELRGTRESQKSTIKNLKSSNEDLKLNNKVLQLNNEGLESFKEELQSLNEELTAVNGELQAKVDELALAQGDMINLLDSARVAAVFLDAGLRIRRFTHEAARLVNLRRQDVGRPVREIATGLDYDNLADDAQKALETNKILEREAAGQGGDWYHIRLMPSGGADNQAGGVVITLSDASELRKTRDQAEAGEHYNQCIMDTMHEPFLVLDKDYKVLSASRSFYRFFKTTPTDIQNRPFYEMDDKQWDMPELHKLLEEQGADQPSLEDFTVEQDFQRIGKRRLALNTRRLTGKAGGPDYILLAFYDQTKDQA